MGVAREWWAVAGEEAAAPACLVSVVIPTLNEADNLVHLLPGVPPGYEVVVVDGGSTDGTCDVARALRPDAIVVRQPGRGKGDALLHGFAVASGDILVTLDADGSARCEEIPRFVEALLDGADFAKGSRFLDGGGSDDLTPLRRAGNRLLIGLVNVLYGTRYTDLCYGYNAFWRSRLRDIPPNGTGFEIEALMHVSLARSGALVVEVPSYERTRRAGESHLRTFRDGARVLSVILRERLRRRPTADSYPQPQGAEVASDARALAAVHHT